VWPYDAVRRRMEWGGVGDLPFEFISHSQTMTRCKPSVDYYRELLERIGRTPEQCLMIGNDARKDLPAREIGIETYLLGSYDELKERLNPCLSA
jgi:FMN phosphatase YigB (HAD superfamily)